MYIRLGVIALLVCGQSMGMSQQQRADRAQKIATEIFTALDTYENGKGNQAASFQAFNVYLDSVRKEIQNNPALSPLLSERKSLRGKTLFERAAEIDAKTKLFKENLYYVLPSVALVVLPPNNVQELIASLPVGDDEVLKQLFLSTLKGALSGQYILTTVGYEYLKRTHETKQDARDVRDIMNIVLSHMQKNKDFVTEYSDISEDLMQEALLYDDDVILKKVLDAGYDKDMIPLEYISGKKALTLLQKEFGGSLETQAVSVEDQKNPGSFKEVPLIQGMVLASQEIADEADFSPAQKEKHKKFILSLLTAQPELAKQLDSDTAASIKTWKAQFPPDVSEYLMSYATSLQVLRSAL